MGCCRLEKLYVKTESSPIPRPLLAHYPKKTGATMWECIGLGHVPDVYVCSHFAQPNSIEYEPALKWRRLEQVREAEQGDREFRERICIILATRAWSDA